MWMKNKGKTDDEVLQNRFTAYIASAIQRRRRDYMIKLAKNQELFVLIEEIQPDATMKIEEAALSNLPILTQIQNEKLLLALQTLNERELYVLLSYALGDKELITLAGELRMTYKGVAAIYYRAVKKVKKYARGCEHGF